MQRGLSARRAPLPLHGPAALSVTLRELGAAHEPLRRHASGALGSAEAFAWACARPSPARGRAPRPAHRRPGLRAARRGVACAQGHGPVRDARGGAGAPSCSGPAEGAAAGARGIPQRCAQASVPRPVWVPGACQAARGRAVGVRGVMHGVRPVFVMMPSQCRRCACCINQACLCCQAPPVRVRPRPRPRARQRHNSRHTRATRRPAALHRPIPPAIRGLSNHRFSHCAASGPARDRNPRKARVCRLALTAAVRRSQPHENQQTWPWPWCERPCGR